MITIAIISTTETEAAAAQFTAAASAMPVMGFGVS